MMASNEETLECLNGLIMTCRDGEEGFRAAVDGVQQFELKEMFRTFSSQRGLFVRELQSEVRTLGGNPETAGSFTGALHRGWMNIRSVVAGTDEAAVVAECEREEDSAIEAYKEVLKVNLPLTVQNTIRNQFAQLKEAHDKVHEMEEELEKLAR